jgi:hypothetical protein
MNVVLEELWGSFQKTGEENVVKPTKSGNKYRRAAENGRKVRSGSFG